jgi:uncharacterized protein YndB with AHSA1/START domain
MSSNTMEKAIQGEVLVRARLEEVWNAWTTEAGAKTFFSPACNIDLRPDGPYEIYFNLDAPPGERGGEGLRVLAVQPMQMFSFTWNAPPSLPEVRGHKTHVILRFFAEGDDKTHLTLYHDGWGTGGEWDEAFEYFNQAWTEVVLPRLKYRFEKGPVDWENPPDTDTLSKMIE